MTTPPHYRMLWISLLVLMGTGCQQDEFALEPPLFSLTNVAFRPGLPDDSLLADVRLIDNQGLSAYLLTLAPAFDDPTYFAVSPELPTPLTVERALNGRLLAFRDTVLFPARRVPGRYVLVQQARNLAGVLSAPDSLAFNIGNAEFPDITLNFLGRADTAASVPVRVSDTLRLAGQVRVAVLPAALRLLAYPAADTSGQPRLIFERIVPLTDSLESPFDVRLALDPAVIATDTVLTVELQALDPAQRGRVLRRPLVLRQRP